MKHKIRVDDHTRWAFQGYPVRRWRGPKPGYRIAIYRRYGAMRVTVHTVTARTRGRAEGLAQQTVDACVALWGLDA